MTTSVMDGSPGGSFLGGVVFAGRVHVPVGHALVAAEVALRADVIEDRIVSVGVLDEEDFVGTALLALLRLRADVLPAEHCPRHADGRTRSEERRVGKEVRAREWPAI